LKRVVNAEPKQFSSAVFFSASGIAVGESSCHPDDPDFRLGGKFGRYSLAFPRRALWIQPEHHAAFVADATKITLYGPDDAFERRPIDPAGGHAEWITFSQAVVQDVVASLGLRLGDRAERLVPRPYVSAMPSVFIAHRCLHDQVRDGALDAFGVEEAGVTLLAHTLAALSDAEPRRQSLRVGDRQHRLVQDTCAYLNRTYKTGETLSMVASAAGTSVFHLCRLFRRCTGKTLHQYRCDLRLRDAVSALDRDEVDVLTVALDAGYSGHSHFTAAFRRAFDMTPSMFRELRRSGRLTDLVQRPAFLRRPQSSRSGKRRTEFTPTAAHEV